LTLVESRCTVYTHRLPGVPFTRVKAGSIIAGHVPFATHHIVDVIADRRRLRRVLTATEAEFFGRDEIRPLVQLLELARKSGREYKTSNWIAFAVRTMRIQFSSGVSSRDIYFGQVTNTSDLDVVWGLYKVRASNGTIRDKARSIARLDAP